MAAGAYVQASVLLAVIVVALALAGWYIRRLLLADWTGAPARLAEAVIALAAMILAAQLLGAVGALRRGPLVAICVVLAVAAASAARRAPAPLAGGRFGSPPPPPPAPPAGRLPCTVAALAVTAVLIRWMEYALNALYGGIVEYDTLFYHLPIAARFAQGASVTGLHYVGDGPVAFYPANGELVHAIGMVLVGNDVLSPLLNLGWLALALLAGWCIGRPSGLGPATTVAVALVCALPGMAGLQPGSAKNDIVALALLLAAVALLVNGCRSRRVIALAALAAGLACGTRLNLLVPVAALGVVVVALEQRGRRAATTACWIGATLAGGGFWFARNLVAVSNPLPFFAVHIPGVVTLPATTAPAFCGTRSLGYFVANPALFGAQIVPQLPSALGGRWWLLLAMVAVGIAAGVTARGAPLARAIAVVALVSAVAYVLTPATAGGANGRCFDSNTRFAIPAIALGVLLLPLVLARTRKRGLPAVAALALAVAVMVRVPFNPAPVLAAAGAVAATCVIASGAWRALGRRDLVACLAALALLAGLAGWRAQRTYLEQRWADPILLEPAEDAYRVLRDVRGARVAVRGMSAHYPLYGLHLANRVEFPAARAGARFVEPAGCEAWLAALSRGRYGYVMTATMGERHSPAAGWTAAYPGAVRVLAAAPGATNPRGDPWSWQLYRLVPGRAVPAGACERSSPAAHPDGGWGAAGRSHGRQRARRRAAR